MEWWTATPANIFSLPLIYFAGCSLEILVDGWKGLGSLKIWARLPIFGFGIWALIILITISIPTVRDIVSSWGNHINADIIGISAILAGAFTCFTLPIAYGIDWCVQRQKLRNSLRDRRLNGVWS